MEVESNALFDSIDVNGDGFITKVDLIETLAGVGISLSHDQRLKQCKQLLKGYKKRDKINPAQFASIIGPSRLLIEHALTGHMAVPNWGQFCETIRDLYKSAAKHEEGKVADYIPQLARVNPDQFGLSVCTIDGQRLDLGEYDVDFCVQSTCKPINYIMALQEHGEDHVHKYVGREPSGVRFNALALSELGLPHNPMINSGAIMCCSLLQPNRSMAQRFGHVLKFWKDLSGNSPVGYSNPTYLSERATADRNFALAHFMRGEGAFPPNTDIVKTLELYFQCCSIEMNCQSMSVVAATLANGGVCPLTEEKVVDPRTVRNCLSLMSSCGMYDFSGEFAFTIGLPAKSGVSGVVLLVIPDKMGIAVWSPRLDKIGNSVRGVAFCKEFIKQFNFHVFDSVVSSKYSHPAMSVDDQRVHVLQFIYAAADGDLTSVTRLVARKVDINGFDYDRRGALHLAAANGHLDIVKYLVRKNGDVSLRDRWGSTPLDIARAANNDSIVRILEGVEGTTDNTS